MSLQDLEHSLDNRIDEIEKLIKDAMPSKGDVECDCQRLTLLNRLGDFASAVNGITEQDLIEEEES